MLLSNMELLATAPGGVAKLRELILTLAVQGKLVPQDPADEPASVLLQKIRAEKDRLIAEGKFKRDKPLAAIAEDKLPCDLPKGWVWARLSELGDFSGGKTPSTQKANFWDGDIPWITPKDMKQLRLSCSEDKVTQMAVDDGLALIPTHSVLIVVRSGILRRTVPTAVNEVATTINQDLKALVLVRPELATYVQLLVRGFERFILQNLTKIGTTVESIQFEAFAAQEFPVPPLAEQSRIVTRVEALMRLCDALEAKGQLEAAQHAQLVNTLLGTLTASTTPEELAAHWQRVAQHFDLLLDRPEAIDALEQTLLQLAVRGLLMPQDPTDEPASALLQKIRAEKDRLIATGQIKRDKPLPPITDEEKPFELPVGWEWVPLQYVGYTQTGTTPDKKNSDFYGAHIPFIKPGDIYPEFVNYDNEGLSESGLQDSGRLAPSGSILMVCIGTIGKTNIIDRGCSFNQQINSITPLLCVPEFIALYLRSPEFQLEAWERSSSTTISILNKGKWEEIPLTLPPLAEQSRIVTRVAALRRLCADLRQRLADRQSVQARLAEALVETASFSSEPC